MSDVLKITDQEVTEWVNNLSDADKEELKRRALEKRGVERLQPEKEPNLGAMTQGEFEAYKRSLGINS